MDSSRASVRSTRVAPALKVANTSSMLASKKRANCSIAPFIQVIMARAAGEVIQRAVAHCHPLGRPVEPEVNIR
jgi:hypothetical protein